MHEVNHWWFPVFDEEYTDMMVVITFALLTVFALLFLAMAVTPVIIEEMQRPSAPVQEPISIENARRVKITDHSPQAA
jgi:hypothetical protein